MVVLTALVKFNIFNFQRTDGGRSLHINEAKLEDGGNYACVAVNPAGESKMMVDLIITDQITSMKTGKIPNCYMKYQQFSFKD